MSASPPPTSQSPTNNPSTSPSPLTIAKSFIKQYYHILSTTPSQIHKFYKPVSQLSHGHIPNTPSTQISFLEKDKFSWAENACVDFENGSIDAQESVGGGVLLVVTGHMTLLADGKRTGPRPFVQTFFLSHDERRGGGKKHFFVLNDVLRFLAVEEEEEELPQEEIELVEDGEKGMNTAADVDVDVDVEEEGQQEMMLVKETEGEATDQLAQAAPETLNIIEEGLLKPEVEPSPGIVNIATDVTSNLPPPTVNVTGPSSPLPPEDHRLHEKPPSPAPGTSIEKAEESAMVEIPENDVDESSSANAISTPDTVVPAVVNGEEQKENAYETSTAESLPVPVPVPDKQQPLKPPITPSPAPPQAASVSPVQAPAPAPPAARKPKPPGSWASLVAGGGYHASKGTSPTESERKQQPSMPTSVKPREQQGESDTSMDAAIIAAETAKAQQDHVRDHVRDHVKEEYVRRPRGGTGSRRITGYSNDPNRPFEPTSLYIKNVGDSTRESDLRGLFSEYGHRIINVNLYPSRGFAFVDFADPAAVVAIMKEPKTFIVNGRTLEVEKKSGERRGGPSHHRSGNGMSSGRGGGRGHRRSSPRGDEGRRGLERSSSMNRGRGERTDDHMRRRSSSAGGDRRGRRGGRGVGGRKDMRGSAGGGGGGSGGGSGSGSTGQAS